MNFIARLLAKYLGAKMAVQYAGSFVGWLMGVLGSALAGYGITGAEGHIEQLGAGLAGVLTVVMGAILPALFDKKEAEKRPDTPVILPAGK